MTRSSRQIEAAEVDDFLASDKFLEDRLPAWTGDLRPDEWTARWAIRDDIGVVRAGTELRFRSLRVRASQFSISVLYRSQPVYRLDMVDPAEEKLNPPDAFRLNLSARVIGSHVHAWSDNRAYIIANGFGSLPYRRQLSLHLRRVPHALMQISQEANIHVTPQQASFDLPPQGDLI